MEVMYKNHKLNELCHDYRKAQKEFGKTAAEKLMSLINLLESAENLQDIDAMRIYHLHPLQGNRKGEFALDLGRKLGYRLIIIPLDENSKEWEEKEVSIIYKATRIVLVWEVSNHYE